MFQLVIVILIPIVLGIVVVSPFENPPNEELEETPPQPNENITILYILLGIIWLFFLLRILYQISKGTYKIQKKF